MMEILHTFAQAVTRYDGASAAGAGLFWAVYMAIIVLLIASMWKVFAKAGQPGWAALIPIYNTYIMLQIAGRPGWWLLLYFIPLVNIVVSAIVSIDIARGFGKSDVFGALALWLLPFIGYPILGFGDDEYHGSGPSQLAA